MWRWRRWRLIDTEREHTKAGAYQAGAYQAGAYQAGAYQSGAQKRSHNALTKKKMDRDGDFVLVVSYVVGNILQWTLGTLSALVWGGFLLNFVPPGHLTFVACWGLLCGVVISNIVLQ
jgi:hypothetical protein